MIPQVVYPSLIIAGVGGFTSSTVAVTQPTSLAFSFFAATPTCKNSRNRSNTSGRSNYFLPSQRLLDDREYRSHFVHRKRRCCHGLSSTSMVIASRDEGNVKDLLSRYPLESPAASKLAKHGISRGGWEVLLALGKTSTLRPSELLMIQGYQPKDAGDREVYLVLSGECRLEVLGSEVARLLPGDFVGEGSFTSGTSGPRSATVRAKDEAGTEVLAWSTHDLRFFMTEASNAPTMVALQACWMSGLARKLNDVMSALAGEPSPDVQGSDKVEVGDYGFRYPEDVREVESVVPVNSFKLAWWNFAREYRSLRRTFRFGQFKETWIAGPFALIDRFLETSIFPELRPSRVDLPRDPDVQELQRRLGELGLSNEAISQREISRIASTKELLKEQTRQGLVEASILLRSQTPWYVMLPYRVLCWGLDVIFEDRPIQRFWFLETVARMPYFSYLSSLHFLETLGWWTGGAEVRRVHFAEEYNEMQHLRIMESLGGDVLWSDRFLARHAAIVYFWVLTLGYFVSPFLAYNFSELIESHAVDTYTEFLEANEEALKSLPPSPQAIQYYRSDDMYLFDEFQTSRPAFSRRPAIKNLYDVFTAIRDDELEHVKTMFACERGTGDLVSPNVAAATPRWAEDAPRFSKSAQAATGGEFASLRSDIARKSPLDMYYAAGRTLSGWGLKEVGSKRATARESSADVDSTHGVVPDVGGREELDDGKDGVEEAKN